MTSEHDVARAMEVMEAAFDPHWGEAWNQRQLANTLALPGSHLLLANAHGQLAERDEDIAGFILSRLVMDEEELLLIAVSPDRRNNGVGQALLSDFIDQSRSRGATKVFLEMRANNSAESLYRKAGFEPIGLRKDYYKTATGSRIDAITFAKTL